MEDFLRSLADEISYGGSEFLIKKHLGDKYKRYKKNKYGQALGFIGGLAIPGGVLTKGVSKAGAKTLAKIIANPYVKGAIRGGAMGYFKDGKLDDALQSAILGSAIGGTGEIALNKVLKNLPVKKAESIRDVMVPHEKIKAILDPSTAVPRPRSKEYTRLNKIIEEQAGVQPSIEALNYHISGNTEQANQSVKNIIKQLRAPKEVRKALYSGKDPKPVIAYGNELISGLDEYEDIFWKATSDRLKKGEHVNPSEIHFLDSLRKIQGDIGSEDYLKKLINLKKPKFKANPLPADLSEEISKEELLGMLRPIERSVGNRYNPEVLEYIQDAANKFESKDLADIIKRYKRRNPSFEILKMKNKLQKAGLTYRQARRILANPTKFEKLIKNLPEDYLTDRVGKAATMLTRGDK